MQVKKIPYIKKGGQALAGVTAQPLTRCLLSKQVIPAVSIPQPLLLSWHRPRSGSHAGLYVGVTGKLLVTVLGKHSAKLLNGAALLPLTDT